MYNERGLCAFANKECQYYPCHNLEEIGGEINCLFCCCPLYNKDCKNFSGTPELVEVSEGRYVRDCSKCVFPHKFENEQKVWDILRGN